MRQLIGAIAGLALVAALGRAESGKRMEDGKEWTTRNLDAVNTGSYCYDNIQANCQKYGRLYFWEAARRGCESLGGGWRLPTNAEWERLAEKHGGVFGNSADGGHGAYRALISGGSTGFNVVKGGNRDPGGVFGRLEAHGFYWTATETNAANAWFYNFGGQLFVNRHPNGEKVNAFSVRCIRD